MRLMSSLSLFIALSSTMSAHAAKLQFCSRQLLDNTEGFIAYLSMLIEENLIQEKHLLEWVEKSNQAGRLVNPIPENQNTTQVELHEPYEEFQRYCSQSDLDQQRVIHWVSFKIAEMQKNKREQDQSKQQTKSIFKQIAFYPIPVGEFQMGERGSEVKVVLTHDIEMMSTKVTQKMWLDVMGENPVRFDGDLDLPVVNVTFWSVLVFLNRLSEKHGLKPAYHLNNIEWEPGTRAENGSLTSKRNPGVSDLVKQLKMNKLLNKMNPDVYKTEGYRLPTEAEAEFVRKEHSAAPIFDSSMSETGEEVLQSYAWYAANSAGKPHPVGEKKSVKIRDHEFFDLHGLVSEWCWDIHQDKIKGGRNPQGPSSGGTTRSVRGGNWLLDKKQLRPAFRFSGTPDDRWVQVGFRVVRTLSPR